MYFFVLGVKIPVEVTFSTEPFWFLFNWIACYNTINIGSVD